MSKINDFTFAEKQEALKVAGELMKWKFYVMNDCDVVAAKSEEDAKKYYEEFISREEIDEQFEGEREGDFTIAGHVGDLTDEEYEVIKHIAPTGRDGVLYRATALEWLEMSLLIGQTEPFIISSTEY